MNTTHPDALPREKRELNELCWAVFCRSTSGRYAIVNRRGETVIDSVDRKQAYAIVREHNRLIQHTLDRTANVERYNRELNALEIAPNGDDYNTLLDLLDGADFNPPVATGR